MQKTKKGFVHIKEYDLTKLLIDRMGVDIEDDYQLVAGVVPLEYKEKALLLPEYKEYMNYAYRGAIFRPFVNQAHSNYLINMFSDLESCDITFEYEVATDGKYDGTFIIYDDETRKSSKVRFNGIRNLSVLISALVLKTSMNHDQFKDVIGDILKIDKKIEKR